MLALGAALPHVAHNPGLPCPLRAMTGIPCPLCGMTTAVKAGMNGHPGVSLMANPFGLVVIAIAAALLLRPRLAHLPIPTGLIMAGLATSWVWELRRFGAL